MVQFRFGHAAGLGWREAADACLARMGAPEVSGNLGFLYVTDSLAAELAPILRYLRSRTSVEDWVGAVGMGICATGTEYYDEPAIAAMVGHFPEGSFRVFQPIEEDLRPFEAAHGEWVRAHRPHLALVHADPRGGAVANVLEQFADRLEGGFLVGGLASSRGAYGLVAGTVAEGGVSGVLFAPDVAVRTRLSQGCSPIGPRRDITEAERNVVIRLDGRRALDVLREDIGEVLSRDLGRIGGYIFAGLPIEGSDTGDYLVRNLVGLDTEDGLVAIGDWARPGGQLMFCRRDGQTAREDLVRMLEALGRGLARPPRGGVYVSCLGRGVNLFGPDSAELGLIRDVLGEFPLVGFYANGEISHRRLYGYTGVLTLFL